MSGVEITAYRRDVMLFQRVCISIVHNVSCTAALENEQRKRTTENDIWTLGNCENHTLNLNNINPKISGSTENQVPPVKNENCLSQNVFEIAAIIETEELEGYQTKLRIWIQTRYTASSIVSDRSYVPRLSLMFNISIRQWHLGSYKNQERKAGEKYARHE